ncbi:MAG TPA: hypothetical protein GX521_09930 [Firmicutes bacterium]|nr:hypothetical protein [Bacillota bacterium]
MRHQAKSYLVLIIFVLLACSVAGIDRARAEEERKPINIDLTVPKPKQPDAAEDVLEEKYRKILAEVTISEEAKYVAVNIKDLATGLRDLGFRATIVQFKGERSDRLVLDAKLGIEQKVARLDFVEPSALRGQIAVIDQEKMEAKIFQPVTNQIAVRELGDMSKEALAALNVAEDLTSYFDFTQYEIVVLETEEYNGVEEYFLQIDSGEKETLQIRVRSDDWFPSEIIVFEDGVLTGKMMFENVEFNPGFVREELQKLPKVKEVRL